MKIVTERIVKDINGSKKGKVFACVVIFLLSFLVLFNSTLNPFSIKPSGTDGSVFIYVAKVMMNGGIPYKDVFDHKGPLLYLLNYLGCLIKMQQGVWVIEIIFIVSTFFILYKIARLFINRTWSLLSLVICIAPLGQYFEGGNLTEEYAMLFISLSLYIFIDYFENNKITNLRLILCGFCFGAVLLLRANMVGLWAIFCISVLIKNVTEYKSVPWNFLFYFLIGVALIITPIMVWLVEENAFVDFINCYVKFNGEYMNNQNWSTDALKIAAFKKWVTNIDVFISLSFVLFFISINKRRYVFVTYLLYLLFNLITMSLSGQIYAHYAMIMVPSYTYPISMFFKELNKEQKSRKKIKITFAVVLLMFMGKDMVLLVGKSINTSLNVSKTYDRSRYDSIINTIKMNSKKEDKIIVIGNKNSVYLDSDRMSSSKYSYQEPIALISENIMLEFIADMKEKKPTLVVIDNDSPFRYLFTEEDGYFLISEPNCGMDVLKLNINY